MASHLITIENCSVQEHYKKSLDRVDWHFDEGEAWLVTGPNGGGKAAFVRALAGQAQFVPNDPVAGGSSETVAAPSGSMAAPSLPLFSSVFSSGDGRGGTAVVSLEAAAALIEEERRLDESEYLNRQDIGRTGRRFIAEVLGGPKDKGSPLPPIAHRLDSLPEVKLCGVAPILDRGLKFMSTGEIRRTLLCRALLSGCSLLILSDPFAGLDAASRKILLEFFDTILGRQLSSAGGSPFPRIILSMERFHEIPSQINRVLEFVGGAVSFSGGREEYERLLSRRGAEKAASREADKKAFLAEIAKIQNESDALVSEINRTPVPDSLIKFTNVNVGWDDNRVLANLNWEVRRGEHWLIRGPNGSGKTTILELITGDNMQVFREDVSLFGRRRGTGETIWDIKRQLGIVSYRLHVEYRMVGGTDLESVIISGFHDSIGLYEQASDFETATARAWLRLAGFAGREHDSFASLSYGEQRAVLIVRAAVKSPRVLILDEPCHALDEDYRGKILDLLETVAATDTTTLLHVTHDPSEALPCEKHVLELHPGETPMYRIIEEG